MENPIKKITEIAVDTSKNAIIAYGSLIAVILVILVVVVGAEKALAVLKSSLELLLWLVEQVRLI